MEVHRYRGWTVVGVTGDLDLGSAPQLRREVLDQLAAGARRIAVDLSSTDFVDSMGLGVLVAVLKRVRTHDGELVVICPEPRLRRLFELTELVAPLGLRAGLAELPEIDR